MAEPWRPRHPEGIHLPSQSDCWFVLLCWPAPFGFWGPSACLSDRGLRGAGSTMRQSRCSSFYWLFRWLSRVCTGAEEDLSGNSCFRRNSLAGVGGGFFLVGSLPPHPPPHT